MSSAIQTSTTNSAFDHLTKSISNFQQKNSISRNHLRRYRENFFQLIGLLLILYCLIPIPIFVFFLIKSLLYFLLLILFTPLRMFENLSSQSIHSPLFLSLFVVCSIFSFCLVKVFSQTLREFYETKAIQRYPRLNNQQVKRHLLIIIWIGLVLIQTLFILIPISRTIGQKTEDDQSSSSDRYRRFNDEKEVMEIENQTKFDDNEQLKKEILYGVNSLYSAYTDASCFRFQPSSSNHFAFLDTYRSHSPFPVYLSILKSNGPKCYPNYSTSSCAIDPTLLLPSSHTTSKSPFIILFICLSMVICAFLWKKSSSSNQRVQKKIETAPIIEEKNDFGPLNETVHNNFRRWLEQDRNDGFRDLSESCRQALNQHFLNAYETLSIEGLHFTNARIHQIVEDKKNSSLGKLVILGTIDLDHLMFNIVNTQNGRHYSIEAPLLTGRFQIELIINNDRYSMKMKFLQAQLENLKMIDANNILTEEEKQSIIELMKRTICQTSVPCSFYLTHRLEDVIDDTSTASTPVNQSISEKTENVAQSLPISPPPIFREEISRESISEKVISKSPSQPEREVPKKLLVRIVKAVKLHDVEQPYCILELNQPKQIHQTSIAKNGLNPFWDEHFQFDCNQKSNQIHLQIFDRRKPNKKSNQQPLDRIYADVFIPFAYVTSATYKQDVRITPQHPDSIIRIEFSTVFDEDSFSNEILPLPSQQQSNNQTVYSSVTAPLTIADGRSTSSVSTLRDDHSQIEKSRKKKSLLCSLKHLSFSRRKDPSSNTSSQITITQDNQPSQAEQSTVSRTQSKRSVRKSIRNIFRSKSNKSNNDITNNNFILDHPDLLTTSTPVPKKRSFFQRNKLKNKKIETSHLSANSLSSYDCSRSESPRNTPIRANVGHPVTMNKTVAQ